VRGESQRFQRSNLELLRIANDRLLVDSLLTPSVRLLAGMGLLLLLYLGTQQMQSGTLQASGLVSILLYGMLLTRPVSGLAGVYSSLQNAGGAAGRLVETFALQPEPDAIGTAMLGPISGHVAMENVHFSYPGRPQVLAGINLQIYAGETVTIVGKNGSGKSNLVHLLMRFADPDQGRVLVDDINICDVTIASLRRRIGVVVQHVLLLNGSVQESIAYSYPEADPGEIEAARRQLRRMNSSSACHKAMTPPSATRGSVSPVVNASGLSLARALLKDPPTHRSRRRLC